MNLKRKERVRKIWRTRRTPLAAVAIYSSTPSAASENPWTEFVNPLLTISERTTRNKINLSRILFFCKGKNCCDDECWRYNAIRDINLCNSKGHLVAGCQRRNTAHELQHQIHRKSLDYIKSDGVAITPFRAQLLRKDRYLLAHSCEY